MLLLFDGPGCLTIPAPSTICDCVDIVPVAAQFATRTEFKGSVSASAHIEMLAETEGASGIAPRRPIDRILSFQTARPIVMRRST